MFFPDYFFLSFPSCLALTFHDPSCLLSAPQAFLLQYIHHHFLGVSPCESPGQSCVTLPRHTQWIWSFFFFFSYKQRQSRISAITTWLGALVPHNMPMAFSTHSQFHRPTATRPREATSRLSRPLTGANWLERKLKVKRCRRDAEQKSDFWHWSMCGAFHIYIYIYMCVCVCVCVYTSLSTVGNNYIYIYIYIVKERFTLVSLERHMVKCSCSGSRKIVLSHSFHLHRKSAN